MSTQVPSISTAPKVSGPEIPHSDQMLEPTKGRIGLHDLDVALDRFEDEALGQFQNLSFEERRIYEKTIDRYVIKLRRQFFYLCNNGVHADLIREKFMTSLANYQGILTQFKAGNLTYQTAHQKETTQNLDLKTRMMNTFLHNAEWAFCDGIPPAIDYDKIPPATQQFSFASPPSHLTQEYACQETKDLIDQTMCYWEGQASMLAPSQRKKYLDDLNYLETYLLGKMQFNEDHETPAYAHGQTQAIIKAAREELKKEFPNLPL